MVDNDTSIIDNRITFGERRAQNMQVLDTLEGSVLLTEFDGRSVGTTRNRPRVVGSPGREKRARIRRVSLL
jgi:hypothetical protein